MREKTPEEIHQEIMAYNYDEDEDSMNWEEMRRKTPYEIHQEIMANGGYGLKKGDMDWREMREGVKLEQLKTVIGTKFEQPK